MGFKEGFDIQEVKPPEKPAGEVQSKQELIKKSGEELEENSTKELSRLKEKDRTSPITEAEDKKPKTDVPTNVEKVEPINREKELYSEQSRFAKEAFDSAKASTEIDKHGNEYKPLTREEACALSDKLKKQIDSVPDGERGDYRVPEPEKIKGVRVNKDGTVRIVENWKPDTDGAKPGTRHMEVVKANDEKGNPTLIDRVGSENGAGYFSPMNADGKPYSLKERAIGDYLPHENIQDNDSYHLYEIKIDFTRENFEQAINEKYIDNPEKREYYIEALNEYYKDATDESAVGHDGEKYCDCSPENANGVKAGEIDQMFTKEGDEYGKGTDGGGKQFITPFSPRELKELGMIEEI